MNEQRVSVPLNPCGGSSRPIKAGALAVFKAVRWIGREGAKTPDRMARIKQDVAEAWRNPANVSHRIRCLPWRGAPAR